ncbi:ATP-binding protein [Vibrio sp. S4M6]|uniref:AAA family ATPase n=1 Tax=Vibrio sinus TaxID=2946865 RepID=UPI00202A14BD|nr:AAA family ATPase [Vibrio sinus]MCL9783166.1 ATP-binding protein [Vibrio sinus]
MSDDLTLTLIRGLPGSGKSTLAKTFGAAHFEADMYFLDSNGVYVFDPSKLRQAHAWCQLKTGQALSLGQSVVVSNTFCRLWEMRPYEKLAKRYRAQLRILECTGQYDNVHGVPDEAIRAMKNKWQAI